MVFGPGGNTLASPANDSRIRLRDIKSATLSRQDVRLWSAETGKLLYTLSQYPLHVGTLPPVVEEARVTLRANTLDGEGRGHGALATLRFQVLAVKISRVKLMDVRLARPDAKCTYPALRMGGWLNCFHGLRLSSDGKERPDISGYQGPVNFYHMRILPRCGGDQQIAPENRASESYSYQRRL